MKDTLAAGRLYVPGARGGSEGGDGRDWRDVSPRERCPVCGSDSWCQVSREGDTVLCKRIASDREKLNRDGVTFFVHRSGESSRPWERAPVRPRSVRAPVEVRDRAYRAVLSQLSLDGVDLAAIVARGLSVADITANGYRSLDVPGRARIARAIIEAVGEAAAAGVPGVVWKTEGDRGWWSFGGSPGVLVPLRDIDGRIAALKVRRRDPCEGQRYLYVSSAKYDGPGAASVVHVPVAARAMRGKCGVLRITEGEFKADLATALLGAPVVSIPGVGSWAAGVDLALAWGVPVVEIALDMDALTNPRVAEVRRLMVSELRREGVDARIREWDPKFKGIDDYLVARRRGEV